MSSYRDTQKDAAAWTDLEGFGEDDEIDDDAVGVAFSRYHPFILIADDRMTKPFTVPLCHS
jgi:hypothetical protein